MSRGGVFRDPRLRGRYQEWLASQGTAPYNAPGQDYNRSQQGVNAMQGRQYHTAARRPVYSIGQRLQQSVRNRPNEQAGMPKPAAPSTTTTALPTRRM